MTLTSRPASGEQDHKAIGELLLRMFEEVARAPLNAQKACVEIVNTIENNAAYIVEDDGKAVATAGIISAFLFYSDAPFLQDQWFYVAPEYRKGNEAFKLLLKECQTLSDSAGMPVFLHIFNDKRIQVRDSVTRVAQELAIYPAGVKLEIEPREAAE